MTIKTSLALVAGLFVLEGHATDNDLTPQQRTAENQKWCNQNKDMYDRFVSLMTSGRELPDHQVDFVNEYFARCIR